MLEERNAAIEERDRKAKEMSQRLEDLAVEISNQKHRIVDLEAVIVGKDKLTAELETKMSHQTKLVLCLVHTFGVFSLSKITNV
jgi:uncharacterized coiled-coil protein SlyX